MLHRSGIHLDNRPRSKIADCNQSHNYLAPTLGVTLVGISSRLLASETQLESLGYSTAFKEE